MSYEDERVEEVEELGLSAAKRGVLFLGGQLSSAIVTLILLIFLARYLQPALYGLYTIAIAFNGILGITSNFGIGTAFRKMLPEMKKNDKKAVAVLLSNGYFVAASLGLIIAVLAFVFSGYIATNIYQNPSLTLPLQMVALAEFLTVLFGLTQGALVGLEQVGEAAVANATYSISNLIGSIALVLAGFGVAGAIGGLLLGLLLGTVVGLSFIARKIGIMLVVPTRSVIKRITSFSAPVVASYVAVQGAQYFSVLLLGVYVTAAVVGNFGAAYKLARFVELTITSITFILVGTFSAALVKKETAEHIGRIYNESLYYSALFLFPLVAYAVSIATPVANLLFTAQYATAPSYFAVMVVGMVLGIIGSYAGTLIIGKGDTKRFMKYQVGAVVVQLLLLFLLTPTYQALGVLIALYIVTPLLLDIIYIRALEEQFAFKHKFAKLARLAFSAIILGLIMSVISVYMHNSKWVLIVNAIVLTLLSPPVFAIFGGVARENLEFIRKTAERLKPIKWLVELQLGYAYIFVRK